jgi:predicted RNA-binding Zn ribbon-like protein
MVAHTGARGLPTGLGRLCLNFVATVVDRRGQAAERLCSPGALADWLVAVGPLDQAPALGEPDLRQARALREAIYRLVTENGDPDPANVRLLNRLARHPTPIPSLSADGAGRNPDSRQTSPAALSVIARDAIDLLSSPARQCIRMCAAEQCGAPFLDTSRPGKRRWCYMGRCGNQAKKARYRRQHP